MATAGTFQGHIMALYVGGVKVVAMKGVNFDMGSAMLDMNNADTGDFDTVKPARRNWSASGNGQFQFDANYGFKELFDVWKAGTKITCKFATVSAGDVNYTGDGYIESLKASFPDHEIATYDFSIKGTSDITKATNP
jgi:hypothetical protein